MVRRSIAAAALAACLMPAGPALAEQMSGGGYVVYTPSSTETLALANGDSLHRVVASGIVLSSDPEATYHLGAQTCTTTFIVPADGGATVSKGFCDGVDRAGDAWWVLTGGAPERGIFRFVGGTGRYAAIDGGGTTRTVVQYPDGRYAIAWEGKWTQ